MIKKNMNKIQKENANKMKNKIVDYDKNYEIK